MRRRNNKYLRVTHQADIRRLFSSGRRLGDRAMRLYAVPNALPHARVGVGVSKRHGNAVCRNRIKRLCREAFRAVRPDVPAGWDFFIVPQIGVEHTLAALTESLRKLIPRITKNDVGREASR